jgi:hypothetical protein
MQLARQRQDCPGLGCGIEPAKARDQPKARAQHTHSATVFFRGQIAQRAIAWVQRKREGRQAERVDHHQVDIAARCHGLHLAFDEDPEIGSLVVRIER